MKTKLTVLSFVLVASLSVAAVLIAYHQGYQRGFRHGGDEERACWTVEPASPDAWQSGVIIARRDTRKHPLLAGRIVLHGDRCVNSIPVKYSP
jgi:hypothetical protein